LSTGSLDVRSLAAANSFVTADGSTIRELCGLPTGGTAKQSLAEATLEPGQATQRHYHRETEEIYFVLDGEGEMELEGARARVAPGHAIPIAPGARHQIRNVGSWPLRILCCCSPPYRHEDTFFD
jgi:mannose-6-phosphate isomerase-like protein (cupin superfamily)